MAHSFLLSPATRAQLEAFAHSFHDLTEREQVRWLARWQHLAAVYAETLLLQGAPDTPIEIGSDTQPQGYSLSSPRTRTDRRSCSAGTREVQTYRVLGGEVKRRE